MIYRLKISVCAVIFIIFMIIPFIAFAGTVGNPASTDSPKGNGVFSLKQDKKIAIKTGVDLEFLFEKKLKGNAASNLKLTSGQWYMAKISYTFFDRVEPYIKLGVAHFKSKWTEVGQEVKLESNTGFAWGLGGKVLILNLDKPKFKLIGDGMYRIADLDGETGSVAGSTATLNTSQSKFVLREWQLALLAATEIDISGPGREEVLGVTRLVPYAGVKYSDMNGRMRLVRTNGNFNNPGEIEAKDNFGIVAGCDIMGTDSVSINLEGRFIDETAITGGLAVMF